MILKIYGENITDNLLVSKFVLKIYRIVLFICSIFFICRSSLQASQYGPNTLFQAPYESDEYIGNFTGTFCAGKTDQSYDRSGNVVPFLQNYGKEDILLELIRKLNK